MMRNFFYLFIFAIIVSQIDCELSEKDMDDLENDMVISLKKFRKNKEEEEILRKRLCDRNLKAQEWMKLSQYCFNQSMSKSKCPKCKELFSKSFETCNKKVPQKDGCDEITFNKRGACQMELFEQNRQETLVAYRDNKEEFLNLIKNINDCYKVVIEENTWTMLA